MKLNDALFRSIILNKRFIFNPDIFLLGKIISWTRNMKDYRLVVIDNEHGDSETDEEELIEQYIRAKREDKDILIWIPGKYWLDEPSTVVLEVLGELGHQQRAYYSESARKVITL